MSSLYDGMREHAKQVSIDTEIAGGAYWHPNFDPLDPMTFEDSHSSLPIEKETSTFNPFSLILLTS